MNDRMKPTVIPAAALDLDKAMAARQQQRVQRAVARAQNAFSLLHVLVRQEPGSPGLPRCRQLVDQAFDVADYFQTRSEAGLKEER